MTASASTMANTQALISCVAPSPLNETDSQIIWPWNPLSAADTPKNIRAAKYHVDPILNILGFIALVCLPFILTYLFTFVESISARKSKKVGKKAPLVPYVVPIVGHALVFLWSFNHLIKKNT